MVELGGWVMHPNFCSGRDGGGWDDSGLKQDTERKERPSTMSPCKPSSDQRNNHPIFRFSGMLSQRAEMTEADRS